MISRSLGAMRVLARILSLFVPMAIAVGVPNLALADPTPRPIASPQLIELLPSTVTLRTSDWQTTFIAGVPVILVAEVSPGPPGGFVNFYDGASYLGTGTLYGTQATLSVTFPTGSSPSITAHFGGSFMSGPGASTPLVLTESFAPTKENLALNTAQDRMRHLFLDQPDLTQLLRGTPVSGLEVTASGKNGTVSGFATLGPLWVRLAGSRTDDGSTSSHYALLSFGSHRQIGDEAILGLMGQIDSIGYSDATGSAEGTGWLVGPYAVTRLGHLPLWLEGRLLWGQSRNHIHVEGQPTEDINGDRFLGLVKLSGEFGHDSLSLRPYLSYGHGTESFDLFTTSQGIPILGTSEERTEAALGLDFTTQIATATGTLHLDGGFGLVRITEDQGGQNGTTFRLRLGLDHTSDRGLRSYLHLVAQGGGSLDSHTVGADLGIELTF